jgi:hypothetical protein
MMKLFFTLLVLPFLVAGTFEGCEKEPLAFENEFNVKVVASFCAYTILEIQDPEYSELGMDWKEYQHVFTVANPCDLPEDMQIGMAYKCQIIEKPIDEDCIQCAGFMETPAVSRNIKLSH